MTAKGLDERSNPPDPALLAWTRPRAGSAEVQDRAAGRMLVDPYTGRPLDPGEVAAQNAQLAARKHGSGYWTSQTGGDGGGG